jgi:hypothetical protein
MTHPLFRNRFFLAASLLMLSSGLAACSDDPETSSSTASTSSSSTGAGGAGGEGGAGGGSGGAGGGMAMLGDIEVTVNYMGMVMVTDMDSLNVAAFEVGKPMGIPPAFFTQKNPMFPAKGTLAGLEPGSYTIFAVLDIGSNNPSMPGPEDLVATSSMPVEVKGGDAPAADVTIMDK